MDGQEKYFNVGFIIFYLVLELSMHKLAFVCAISVDWFNISWIFQNLLIFLHVVSAWQQSKIFFEQMHIADLPYDSKAFAMYLKLRFTANVIIEC